MNPRCPHLPFVSFVLFVGLSACAPAPDPRIGQLENRVKFLEAQVDLWAASQTKATAGLYQNLHEHVKLIDSVQDAQRREHQLLSGPLDDMQRLAVIATNRPGPPH